MIICQSPSWKGKLFLESKLWSEASHREDKNTICLTGKTKTKTKTQTRLHPPFPLLVPHGSREQCKIDGYDIPIKQRVFINVWVCATDPEYWEEPDSFKPKRFKKTSVDFIGNDYQFILFGSGRRICPGIYFGLRTLELFLAQMLNNYDWKLPRGLNPSDLDTIETLTGGVLVVKKDPLHLIPTPYSSAD
ncbi:hypothetical protein L6452_32092 [Arctium lappa]|uniref:Uncharacterized protein n=1 Tax=Arctium lappa TaxID=4217 RepID=A0ACB8Z3V5_ARCLA|nr:hypothetical protein L6452_32092 [Arctium lappa]